MANVPAASVKKFGRPPGQNTIADRAERLKMVVEASRFYPEIIKYWGEVFRNSCRTA